MKFLLLLAAALIVLPVVVATDITLEEVEIILGSPPSSEFTIRGVASITEGDCHECIVMPHRILKQGFLSSEAIHSFSSSELDVCNDITPARDSVLIYANEGTAVHWSISELPILPAGNYRVVVLARESCEGDILDSKEVSLRIEATDDMDKQLMAWKETLAEKFHHIRQFFSGIFSVA